MGILYVRKKKQLKGLKRFLVERVEIETFEQRYNTSTGIYYLYNPYTGECITDIEISDRRISTWILPDPHINVRDHGTGVSTFTHTLFGEWYESTHHKRRWERGKYAKDKNAAATLLIAAARGFIIRRRMRHVHRKNYHRIFDEEHQCCYFLNLLTGETSWYKPHLAHPYSIQPPPPDTRSDAVDSSVGPLFTKTIKGGRENIPKKELKLKLELAMPTEREPSLPDLNSDYLFLMMWFDDNIKKMHKMQPLYNAYERWDWLEILRYMLTYVDEELVQLFALYAFERMEIPMAEDGKSKTKVDQIVRKVMNYLFYLVQAWGPKMKFGCNMLLLLHNALLHLFKNHYIRMEFFYGYESRLMEKALKDQSKENKAAGRLVLSINDIEDILAEDLDDVNDAEMTRRADVGITEHIIEEKMQILCLMLKNIPVEITEEQHEKGIYGEVTKVARPTKRASELVLVILKIMGVLAHERDPRESIGVKCGPWIPKTLRLCSEEPYVVQFGLRCLYNFMYMCFEGWRWVHMECDAVQLIKDIRVGPLNGDEGVIRECRRVELSLETDGWRGKVEEQIEKEMQENDISVYLAKKDSPAHVSPEKEVVLTIEEMKAKRKEEKMRKKQEERKKNKLKQGMQSGLISALHEGAIHASIQKDDKEEELSDDESVSSQIVESTIAETSPLKKPSDNGKSALLSVE